MKFIKRTAFLICTLAVINFSSDSAPGIRHSHAAAGRACTGSASCRVCKNCKYCKFCAKQGGTCGVCRRK